MKALFRKFWSKVGGKGEDFGEFTKMEKGRFGEDMAVKFLRDKGMRVISRNWRSGHGEIDIVARDKEALVFIEVKTRREDVLIRGALSVTHKQKRTLERTCKAYLQRMRHKPKHVRFDIVEVKLCQNGENDVNHYSNVRLFSKHFQVTPHA